MYIILPSYESLHRYGCTKVAISDQGREFVNHVSRYLFTMTNTEHRISSAYHPQTNGLIERFNQTLQRSMVKFVNENQSDWDEKLDGILFAYRTSQQKSTRVTPFELMYCRYVICMIVHLYASALVHCIIACLNYRSAFSNYFFRKAVLPIQMELDEQQSESEKDDAEDVEGYAKRMNAFRDNLFLKAKSSIVASQMKQKIDYDKKHGKRKVCVKGITPLTTWSCHAL